MPASLAHRLVDNLAVFDHVQRQRLVRERLQLESANRSHSAGFRSRRDRGLLIRAAAAGLVAHRLDFLLRQLIAGIDLQRPHELGQRSGLVALVAQFFALLDMDIGGS